MIMNALQIFRIIDSLFLGCLTHIICNAPSSNRFSRLRWKLFRSQLKSCTGYFFSGTGLIIPHPKNVSIGSGASINSHVFIDAGANGEIVIGENTLVGPFTVMRAEDHCYDSPEKLICLQGHKPGRIILEEDCWICAHVIITRDVTVGKGSVIGANSVVTHDIPPFSVAVGVPAKVIKTRGRDQG